MSDLTTAQETEELLEIEFDDAEENEELQQQINELRDRLEEVIATQASEQGVFLAEDQINELIARFDTMIEENKTTLTAETFEQLADSLETQVRESVGDRISEFSEAIDAVETALQKIILETAKPREVELDLDAIATAVAAKIDIPSASFGQTEITAIATETNNLVASSLQTIQTKIGALVPQDAADYIQQITLLEGQLTQAETQVSNLRAVEVQYQELLALKQEQDNSFAQVNSDLNTAIASIESLNQEKLALQAQLTEAQNAPTLPFTPGVGQYFDLRKIDYRELDHNLKNATTNSTLISGDVYTMLRDPKWGARIQRTDGGSNYNNIIRFPAYTAEITPESGVTTLEIICGWLRGGSANVMNAFWGLVDERNFTKESSRPWEHIFSASEYLRVGNSQGTLFAAYGIGFKYDYQNQVLPEPKELFKITYTINTFNPQGNIAGILARIVDVDESIINEPDTALLFDPKYEKTAVHAGWNATITLPSGKLTGAVCLKDSIGAEFVVMAARIN